MGHNVYAHQRTRHHFRIPLTSLKQCKKRLLDARINKKKQVSFFDVQRHNVILNMHKLYSYEREYSAFFTYTCRTYSFCSPGQETTSKPFVKGNADGPPYELRHAGTVKPEIFATVLFSLISRVQKIRENKK